MAATMVCILCAVVILKPQEFVPALSGVPIVHILFAICLICGALDVFLGKIRLSLAPHAPLVIAFFLWGTLVTFVRSPKTFSSEIASLIIVASLFGAVAFLPGSIAGVRRVSLAFLGAALVASTVAIFQSSGPLGCMMAAANDWEAKEALEFDGRPCETSADCRKDPPVAQANYRCERMGPWGTSTIGGRVRYRGTLADPNDLSLAAALTLPFALAYSQKAVSKESAKSMRITATFITLASIGVIATMIILSQSRMGVVVFLIVMGLALLRRAGSWGLILALVLLPPVLLLGGRDSADADASSKERLDLIADALAMIRQSHGLGVGMGRFAAESSTGLTAHNSYLLAASELGIVGITLFALMLYAGLKVPLALWFGSDELDPRLKQWSSALAISLVGAYVGIFFLSWAYKEIIYILLGLSGALYQTARQAHPDLRIKLSPKEILIVVAVAITFVPVVYGLVRIVG